MKKIDETIKKYRLIQKGDKILVGVSGGPDSLALLLQLFNLRFKSALSLHIAHVDHGLRKDSREDALFVQAWAKKLDIPVSSVRFDPQLQKKKGSLEEIYRQARLDFFIQTARKIKADKVALGHNLDDQAETVFMRLLRGTGLSGLSGISIKRKIGGVTFIRPLLETRRKEIEYFLKQRRVKPRIDSTNKEDVFFRNKIRNRLMPLLKKEYNQNIVEVLANLAESISYDYEYLDQAAKKAIKGSNLRLNLLRLSRLHPAILRLKIRQSIACVQGDTRRISFQHIKELEDLLVNRPAGSIVDLPKGVAVQKTRTTLKFYKR
ncbi:MAG: tRNA lysidine(34) synthetase TilS [Candidatus Omnitrophica bacterium]|jgi:tRNA(Ile)-lysidine synthase|nr:tRNA lysidine(34) synthetase TilS [Candidatus Omnitrophota bacterium]